jgi:hypothetical protein
MKNDLTTGAWQHDIGCPISIVLMSVYLGDNKIKKNQEKSRKNH